MGIICIAIVFILESNYVSEVYIAIWLQIVLLLLLYMCVATLPQDAMVARVLTVSNLCSVCSSGGCLTGRITVVPSINHFT